MHRNALQREPGSIKPHLRAASAQIGLRQYTAAGQQLEACLKLQPDCRPAQVRAAPALSAPLVVLQPRASAGPSISNRSAVMRTSSSGALKGSFKLLRPAVTLLIVLVSSRQACGRQTTSQPSRLLSRPGSRQGTSKALGQPCPAELCMKTRLHSCSSVLRPCCRLALEAMWPSVQEPRCGPGCACHEHPQTWLQQKSCEGRLQVAQSLASCRDPLQVLQA